eukprot:3733352-Rhodomonas_salina.5
MGLKRAGLVWARGCAGGGACCRDVPMHHARMPAQTPRWEQPRADHRCPRDRKRGDLGNEPCLGSAVLISAPTQPLPPGSDGSGCRCHR